MIAIGIVILFAKLYKSYKLLVNINRVYIC